MRKNWSKLCPQKREYSVNPHQTNPRAYTNMTNNLLYSQRGIKSTKIKLRSVTPVLSVATEIMTPILVSD